MRILSPIEYSFEIEHSRFIGLVYRVFTVEEAKTYLAEVRKKYSDATHIVHAYRIGSTIAHSSDDHEPSGTAGVPIREVLEKNDLTDLIAIVVRYYGGIKLGAGGLARAYSKAISSALDLATFTQPSIMHEYALTLDYSLLGKAQSFIKKQFTLIKVEYEVLPKITFRAKDDPTALIQELTNGKYPLKDLGEVTVELIARRPLKN